MRATGRIPARAFSDVLERPDLAVAVRNPARIGKTGEAEHGPTRKLHKSWSEAVPSNTGNRGGRGRGDSGAAH